MTNGSILAPLAAVTNNTQINGTLVAGSFTQGGEVHMKNFGGLIPGIPEPASWALMIMGFGGAGAVLRRRRVLAN